MASNHAGSQDLPLSQNKLITALDSISEGLALYDAADQLGLANQALLELRTVLADLLVPGTSFETLLRAGLERGHYSEINGPEEACLQSRLDRHRQPQIRTPLNAIIGYNEILHHPSTGSRSNGRVAGRAGRPAAHFGRDTFRGRPKPGVGH